MGPNLKDNITGVFWFAFLLFSFTTASIMSGAAIERIRLGAYLLLAMILGSVVWILAAAWGWSDGAWLYKKFGFHDWGAGGCGHTGAAAFTLGVLLNLGPRIGKYDEQGRPQSIPPHNLPMTMLGLMLIFLFAVELGWLPTSGKGDVRNLVLPAVTLAAYGAASTMRLTRSAMLEVLREDYIRTARSKGLLEKIIINRHALKNALLPVCLLYTSPSPRD